MQSRDEISEIIRTGSQTNQNHYLLQGHALFMRIADEIGTLQARPDFQNNPLIRTFMADLVESVRNGMTMGEALSRLETFNHLLAEQHPLAPINHPVSPATRHVIDVLSSLPRRPETGAAVMDPPTGIAEFIPYDADLFRLDEANQADMSISQHVLRHVLRARESNLLWINNWLANRFQATNYYNERSPDTPQSLMIVDQLRDIADGVGFLLSRPDANTNVEIQRFAMRLKDYILQDGSLDDVNRLMNIFRRHIENENMQQTRQPILSRNQRILELLIRDSHEDLCDALRQELNSNTHNIYPVLDSPESPRLFQGTYGVGLFAQPQPNHQLPTFIQVYNARPQSLYAQAASIIQEGLRNVQHDNNLPPDPVQELLAAARINDRNGVEMFIDEQEHNASFYAQLHRAVMIAAEAEHLDLAAYLMQLITDPNRPDLPDAPAMPVLPTDPTIIYTPTFVDEAPEFLRDPIMKYLFTDPVTICSGITIDRSSLLRWIGEKPTCHCPITRELVQRAEIENRPNQVLSKYLDKFIATQGKVTLLDLEEIFVCPLSKKVFEEPLTLTCGVTVERSALKKLFAEHNEPTIKLTFHDEEFKIHRSELDRHFDVTIHNLVTELKAIKEDKPVAAPPPPVADMDHVRLERIRKFGREHAEEENYPSMRMGL